MNTLQKIMHRISRSFWNKIVHNIILDAMKQNVINSRQAHKILGDWNRACWPERHARKRHGGPTLPAPDKGDSPAPQNLSTPEGDTAKGNEPTPTPCG